MDFPASPDPLAGLSPMGLLALARSPLQGGWLPPSVAELAGTIPGCDPIAMTGRGGMGAVYRALQPALKRQVALKILSPDADEDGLLNSLFQQEIQLLAALQHPNIVTIYEAGTTRTGCAYLIMEWVEGEDAGTLLRHGPLPPERVLPLLRQACQGLAQAHRRGIIHRDIKPSNLLVTPDGHLKITDFGLAALSRPSQNDVPLPAAAGTMDYTAPEAWTGPPDPRSDLYSLGVTAWHLLTGTLPRRGSMVPPSRQCPALPAIYDDILLRAMAREPGQRYPDAGAFLEALDRPRRHEEGLRRRTRLAAVFGILTLLATATGLLAWHQAREARQQRGAALAQREEAAKLIDFLINELMWRFRSEGDQRRFDGLFVRLDEYFARFDSPAADADFCYHLATYLQVKAIHADQMGRPAEAERLYHQLLTARDRHAAAAPANDTALANRADARLRFAQWLHSRNRPPEAAEFLAESLSFTRHPPPLPGGQGQRLIRCGALRCLAEFSPAGARAALTEADGLIQQLLALQPGHQTFLNEHQKIAAALRGLDDAPLPPSGKR